MKCFAAIDIGSFELSMKIFEMSSRGRVKELDHIRHRIELGTDTYNTGKISSARVDELCRQLLEFKRIMKSYDVSDYKIYGTSAIRETSNTLIIIEQIKLRTGLDVEVLSNSEQRFLHLKAVATKSEEFEKCVNEGAVIADIGGGSTQLSLYKEGALYNSQNVRLGILRMREMLADLQPKTRDYAKLVEELVDNHLLPYANLYIGDKRINNLIIIDDYISHIIQRAAGKDSVSAKEYEDFITHISNEDLSKVCKKYDIPEESASLLPTSALLIKRILEVTGADNIWAPGVSLSDGIAYEHAENKKIYKNSHDFSADVISEAKHMAKRYKSNTPRNTLVEDVAVKVFDRTKKLHNLDARGKLLLRVAAILADCGRFVSVEDTAECSYTIIKSTDILGLSKQEQEIVANIVRFNKTHFVYYKELSHNVEITRESYLTLSKLAAIFRISDGVCRSYKPKIKDLDINIKDDELVFNVTSNEDIVLEKGFFERKARLFEEVFSCKPVIKRKKKISGL